MAPDRPSPFTVPQPAFQFCLPEEFLARPIPPMTAGDLVKNLVNFANGYEAQAETIKSCSNAYRKLSIAGEYDANLSEQLRQWNLVPGIDRVREYVLTRFGGELTIRTANLFVGELLRISGRGLNEVHRLLLGEAMDLIESQVEKMRQPPSGPSGASVTLEELLRRGLAKSPSDAEAMTEGRVASLLSTGTAPQSIRAEKPSTPESDSLAALRVYSNGAFDDRIRKVMNLVANPALTVEEKLWKIDALIPIPPTASAEQIAAMFTPKVSKQAVMKTKWWQINRKGEKSLEVGRRQERHRERAKAYELPGRREDDFGR